MAITKTAVKNVLEKALNKVENGWMQGDFHLNENGKDTYCAIGAVRYSSKNDRVRRLARKVLANSLPRAELRLNGDSKTTNDVVSYNDDFTTTKTRIIKLFKRAIKNVDKIQVRK